MTQRTEAETWKLLDQSFRYAIEHTELLATLPMRGPTYQKLCVNLETIERCCREIARAREDGGGSAMPIGEPGVTGFESLRSEMGEPGWLDMAYTMGACHQRAGYWLRTFAPRAYFLRLGLVLRRYHERAALRHTQARRQRGVIMPPKRPEPHRETRPVSILLPR